MTSLCASALKSHLRSCDMREPMQIVIIDIKPTKRLHIEHTQWYLRATKEERLSENYEKTCIINYNAHLD